MANRTAKFASAIFASLLAGVPITINISSFAHAARDCQTEPGNETPQREHWYYRIEHGTERHCWFLREEGERTEQATLSKGAAATSQRNETAVRGAIADAYDELPSPRMRVQQGGGASDTPRAQATMPITATSDDIQNLAPSATPSTSAPADGVPRSPIASRWPDQLAINSSVNPAPAAPAMTVADATPTPQAEPSPALAPATLAAAAAPTQKTAGSHQMLLLLILGALALANLTEGVVWCGRARRLVRAAARRRDVRQSAGPVRAPSWANPRPDNLATRADFAGRPHFARADIQVSLLDDRVERVEECLARLSGLSQNDMVKARRRADVGPRATNLRANDRSTSAPGSKAVPEISARRG